MDVSTIPAWAATKKVRTLNGKWASWANMNTLNGKRLRAAEAKGPVDFIMYGDSITSYHIGYSVTNRFPGSPTIWKKHLGHLNAVPLAIPGDQLGNLVWRLMKGGEKPATPPKVIGLFIGINDCFQFGDKDKLKPRVPSNKDRMDFILAWVQKNCPGSAVVLCALTPNATTSILSDRKMTNAAYKELVTKYKAAGMTIEFVDCMPGAAKADGTPVDASMFSDATHLTPKGHELFLSTLRPVIDRLARSSASTSSTSSPSLLGTLGLASISKTWLVGGVAVCLVCCCCFCLLIILASQ